MKTFSQFISEEKKVTKVGDYTFSVEYKVKPTAIQKKRLDLLLTPLVKHYLKDGNVSAVVDKPKESGRLGGIEVFIEYEKNGIVRSHPPQFISRKGKLETS